MTTFGVAAAALRGAAVAARQAKTEAKTERRARAAAVRAARSTWQAARRAGLTVGAMVAFTWAAWAYDFHLGLLVAGLSALWLEAVSE